MEHLRATDRLGFGLGGFAVARVPKPLAKTQQRYMVPSSSLPPPLGSQGGQSTRACVRDESTGERWLEVLWTDRRLLIEVLDCGSIGWPSKFYLARYAGVRSIFFRDPCHLRFNRVKSAIKESGL